MTEWVRPGAIDTDQATWDAYNMGGRSFVDSSVIGGYTAWADDTDSTGHETVVTQDITTSVMSSTFAVGLFDPFTPGGDLTVEVLVTVALDCSQEGILELGFYDRGFLNYAQDYYTPRTSDLPPAGTTAWISYTMPDYYWDPAQGGGDVATNGLGVTVSGWVYDPNNPFRVFVHEMRAAGSMASMRRHARRCRRFPRE